MWWFHLTNTKGTLLKYVSLSQTFITLKKFTCTYVIIIILLCHQHGYPWSSLATPPNHSSLPVGPQGYTPYPHRAAVCRFELAMWRVHRSTSLISSSLLLQQRPAFLVHLTWKVFVMGGRWPYRCCFVGCCLQDLFNIACSILVLLPSSFFSSCLVSVHVVHPYSRIDTITAWKKLHFIYWSGLTSIWPITYW